MSDRVLFVNPVEKKAMKRKTKKHAKRAAHRKTKTTTHRKKRRRNPAAKQLSLLTKKKAAHVATKKRRKKRAAKTVYRTTKRGGHRRRTVALKGPLYKRSKRGRVRRVRRANPGGFVAPLLAVVAGFATGVAIRVGTHMAAPTNVNAARIAGAVGVLAGVAMAAKMSNPLYGIGVAVGAADAAFQNDAVFKAENVTAPAATQKALGAIAYQNMRGMELARSTPQFARMGALPPYARMGAIVANDMRGFASGQIASMRVQNPFDR